MTRRKHSSVSRVASLLGVASILWACGPSTTPSARNETPTNQAPPVIKTLAIATRGPVNIVLFGGRSGNTTYHYEPYTIFHGNLTAFDSVGNVVPRAAAKVPSIENGDWKVNPDGTMEVTWRIRPDVYWHDGFPMTADDFEFGFEVNTDPRLEVAGIAEIESISSVKAVDARTLRVTWRTLSVQGNVNAVEGIPSLPKHLLEQSYRALDPQAFTALPAWMGEFVGIGPYRVSNYEPGAYLEGAAFDGYYLGRPKIDRIVITWANDTQVTVTRLLAGSLDVILPGAAIFPPQMVEIERFWGKGVGTVRLHPNDIRVLRLNLRVAGQPWDPAQAGWQHDRRFRQALLHSMNRDALADELQNGFTPVLYFPSFHDFPIYQMALQRGLPKYEYNPTRAQQLFAETGWNKGQDGLLRNRDGQAVEFPCCRYPVELASDVQETLAWGVGFQAAGLVVENPVIPPRTAGLSASEGRRVQTVGWGGMIGNHSVTAAGYFRTMIRPSIATEETRWSGINGGAWTNPAYDDLYARSRSIFESNQRLEAEFQMLKILMDELPMFTVYYTPIGLAARKGVEGLTGPNPLNRAIVADIHLWDIAN
jgi:peptide/nickel transport system substrate-binding protein